MNNHISTSVFASSSFAPVAEDYDLEFSIREFNGNKTYKSTVTTDFKVYEITISTKSLLNGTGSANIDIVESNEDGWNLFNLVSNRVIQKSRSLSNTVLFELNEALVQLGILTDSDELTISFNEAGARRCIEY